MALHFIYYSLPTQAVPQSGIISLVEPRIVTIYATSHVFIDDRLIGGAGLNVAWLGQGTANQTKAKPDAKASAKTIAAAATTIAATTRHIIGARRRNGQTRNGRYHNQGLHAFLLCFAPRAVAKVIKGVVVQA